MKEKLLKNTVSNNNSENILINIYKGLNQNTIDWCKYYFDRYHIITNRLEYVSAEEWQECG